MINLPYCLDEDASLEVFVTGAIDPDVATIHDVLVAALGASSCDSNLTLR